MNTPSIYRDQFTYQLLNSRGRILNVGSNTDGAGLADRMGALNLDLRHVDHVTGERMPVHVLGSALALPFRGYFDTVVLGEILEHMERLQAVQALREAYRALRDGGQVVVTMPHDHRRDQGTLAVPEGDKQWYAPGIYAYHYRSIPWAELMGWISEAGLEVVDRSRIHYTWGEVGSGVICKRGRA
jgi:SAM-dependent methyltransferase